MRRLGGIVLLVSVGIGPARCDEPAGPAPLRRPLALVLVPQERKLVVANRCGTVAVVDTTTLAVAAEVPVGQRLADLAGTADGKKLVAVDEAANELIVLRRRAQTIEVASRAPVPPSPVGVALSADGSRCYVTSLWSRQVTFFELGSAAPRSIGTVDLPFAPRRLLLLARSHRLVVADAFGGQLAVVNTVGTSVESVRTLPAQNIRGLAASADGTRLLLTQQQLSATATTTASDIHWGRLITNGVRSVPLATLLSPSADILRGESVRSLGVPGRGAGDPAALAATADGKVVVALAGVGSMAVGTEKAARWARVAIGRRPTALAVTPNGKRAYFADTFDDAVVVVDLQPARRLARIGFGGRGSASAAERGEELFYDARLSYEGWLSCHSCHGDGHTSGALADTIGDGSFGAPKRIPSLLGVGDSGPWAWDGHHRDLESQIGQSVTSTMRGEKLSAAQAADLIAFLRTLAPPPALPATTPDAPLVERGRQVFAAQGCANCHAPPTYTSPRSYDVGLVDEKGKKEFNPPSLRGVSQAGPYFHDGRAATLAEVFTRYRHQLEEPLPKQQLEELLAFLRSL